MTKPGWCWPLRLQIYNYDEEGSIKSFQFEDRLDWFGSRQSNDIQDASIFLTNVTFNDSGTYRCRVNRLLTYEFYEYQTKIFKEVNLTVVGKGTKGFTSTHFVHRRVRPSHSF